MNKVMSIGMDVGTTNSCVAFCNSDYRGEIIQIPGSKNGILPSCVRYKTRTEVEVGVGPYNHKDLPSVVYSMKRHMENGSEYKHHVIADNGEEFDVTPVEVASHVIKAMKDGAEAYFGVKDSVTKVTITVPAYFSELARHNTRLAGIQAGLKKDDITLINEPTAAAVSYGVQDIKPYEKVMVYDLGGGTFDTAILEITKSSDDEVPNYEVFKSGGDPDLGGDDVDFELFKMFLTKVTNTLKEMVKLGNDTNIDLTIDSIKLPTAVQEGLLHSMEVAKISGKALLEFKMKPEWFDDKDRDLLISGGVNFDNAINVPISKEDIESAVMHSVGEKSLRITEELMDENSYTSSSEVSRILLIGGSTKSKYIKDMLKDRYEDIPVKSYTDPDESVALGASIYSEMINRGKGGNLQDCIQIPIGVKLLDTKGLGRSYIKKMINQSQKLPAYSEVLDVETTYDNQDFISIEVYQGSKPTVEECVRLGSVEIKDIPVGKKGEVSFKIRLVVDINGLLSTKIEMNDGKNPIVKYDESITRLSSSSGKEDKPTTKEEVIRARRLNKLKQYCSNEEEYEKYSKELLSLESQKEVRDFFNRLESKEEGKETNLF